MTAPAHQHPHLSPETLARLRALPSSSGQPEEAISILKAAGVDKFESIKWLRAEWHLPLATAKRFVHQSPSWKEQLAADDTLHDALLDAAMDEGFVPSAPPARERAHAHISEQQKA